MLRSAAFLSLMLLAHTVADAQQLGTATVGSRIRVTPIAGSATPWIGVLVGRSGDTLLVQKARGDTIAVPLTTLTRIEVSTGRRGNVLNGVGIGAFAGLLTGAAIGAAVMRDDWLGPRFGTLFGGAVGFGGGALIGGLVGATVQTDRWTLPCRRPAGG